MLDRRMIPNPALARVDMDARLRALGYAPAGHEPRTHLRFRLQAWRRPDGSSVELCEAHVLGERYVMVRSEAPDELARALEVVPRATLLHEAGAAPGPREAMPWLRRLCLLEYDELSPELREHLTRALTSPDLLVRSAAIAAAVSLVGEHAVWALELVAKAETEPTLRAMYRRTAKAERARLEGAPEPSATRGRRKPAAKARPRKKS